MSCYRTPDYSRFCPITADLNHLYNKHTVVVTPVATVSQGSMGGQYQERQPSFSLVCNVQPKKWEEHNDLGNFKSPPNRGGRLYTKVLSPEIKEGDFFVHDGREYRIVGIELFRDNISFEPHHLEADYEETGSRVPKAI